MVTFVCKLRAGRRLAPYLWGLLLSCSVPMYRYQQFKAALEKLDSSLAGNSSLPIVHQWEHQMDGPRMKYAAASIALCALLCCRSLPTGRHNPSSQWLHILLIESCMPNWVAAALQI